MDQYSKESADKNKCKELYDAILIVKGGSTSIARKVSHPTLEQFTNKSIYLCLESDKPGSVQHRSLLFRGALGQHHTSRARAEAHDPLRPGENRTAQEIVSAIRLH